MARYVITYGDRGGYVVQDTQNRHRNPSTNRLGKPPVVFKSESKRACITKAQELNGFTPADGDESIYGRQIIEAAGRVGR